MVFIFTSEKARNHLLREGFVYTLRARRRSIEFGEDWFTDKRSGRKIADVHVARVIDFPVNLKEGLIPLKAFLEAYVKHSGFASVDEWIDEFKRLNRPHRITHLWLYRVSLKQ